MVRRLRDIAGAGRLRTQSQRLAKLYLQAAMGLKAGQARQQIDSGMADVDAEFNRLSRYGRKASVQRVYARSEAHWQEMRGLLKKSPDAASSERMNLVADELMVHTGKLVMQIEGRVKRRSVACSTCRHGSTCCRNAWPARTCRPMPVTGSRAC